MEVGFRDQTKAIALKANQVQGANTKKIIATTTTGSISTYGSPDSYTLVSNLPPESVSNELNSGNDNDAEEIMRADWSASTAVTPFAPQIYSDLLVYDDLHTTGTPNSQITDWVTGEPESPNSSLLYSPRQSPEQLAVAIFFQVYVPGQPGSKGQLDFLPLVYNGAPSRGVLASAILSIGLHTLAGKTNDNHMMLYSRKKYSHTLNELNQALQDMYRARSDEIVTTVLLMAQFESIRNQSLESMFAHLEGAKALIKLRGLDALRTVAGMRIFVSVRAQIALACILRNEKIPEIFIELSQKSKDFVSNGASWVGPLTMTIMSFCNIRARVHAGEVTDVSEILASFYAVDAEISAWPEEVSADMLYTRVPATPSASVFSEYYDIYANYWSYGIWNHYRTIHILCLESLMRFLTQRAAATDDLEEIAQIDLEKTKKREHLRKLADDVCASMHYYKQIVSNRNSGTASGKPDASPATTSYAGEGVIVMWPLGTIAGCPWSPVEMRRFAITQLQSLGHSSGNKQAAVLAKRLESGMVHWQLGS